MMNKRELILFALAGLAALLFALHFESVLEGLFSLFKAGVPVGR
jgi:hypothetical protein